MFSFALFSHLTLLICIRSFAREKREKKTVCVCLIFSDECFSLEAIEGRGGRAAVSLSEMQPLLLSQMQPDEAFTPRVWCRAKISVRELQEAIQAPSSPAGPPEDPPLRELQL